VESQVYYGSWKKSKQGFTLWITDHPEWKGVGKTYAEAEEQLLDAILLGNKHGVSHALIEYVPALPRSTYDMKYSTPALVVLHGDERPDVNAPRWHGSETARDVDNRLRWTDEYYTQPVCRACKMASTLRTSKPITLGAFESGYDGMWVHSSTTPGNIHYLFSEEFLSLLTTEERDRLQFHPSINLTNKRKYVELVGPAGVPLVGLQHHKVAGWQCSTCGYRCFGYWSRDFSLTDFVAREDLPTPLPGLFTIGTLPDLKLVATVERWQEMVGKKGAKKIIGTPIGVVPTRELLRVPELPPR
jgi:hypothetical protein